MSRRSLVIFSVLLIIVFCQMSASDGSKISTVKKYATKGVKIFKILYNGALSLTEFKDLAEAVVESVEVLVKDPEMSVDEGVRQLGIKIDEVKNHLVGWETKERKKYIKGKSDKYIKEAEMISFIFRRVSSHNRLNITIHPSEDIIRFDGVEKNLREMYDTMFGREGESFEGSEGLFTLLTDNYELLFPCSIKSRQQFFYDLMIAILTAEAKVRVLLENAYKKKLHNHTDTQVTKALSDAKEASDLRVQNIYRVFKNVLSNASRVMQACDLGRERHKQSKTYTKLENAFELVQYVYEPRECSARKRIASKCEYSGYQFNYEYRMFRHYDNKQRECQNVVECAEPASYELCMAKDQETGPRYQYIEEKSKLGLYGDKALSIFKTSKCKSGKEYTVDTTLNPACVGACSCVCADRDQYFDLKDVTSNIDENYVVTGVRFVKEYWKVIYIQIKQGKLLPAGLIHKSDWVSINETMVWRIKDRSRFFKLEWPYARGIALKTERAPKNYVITGVRFASEYTRADYMTQHYLNLEIQVTKFNAETGQLDVDDSYWQPSSYFDYLSAKNINLFKARNAYEAPTNVNEKHTRSSTTKDQLKLFEPTGMFTSDVGSSTVPYLDIQEVVSPKRELPLGAVGIHHLEAPNSGGYIALHAESLDVMQFFSNDDSSFIYNINETL